MAERWFLLILSFTLQRSMMVLLAFVAGGQISCNLYCDEIVGIFGISDFVYNFPSWISVDVW